MSGALVFRYPFRFRVNHMKTLAWSVGAGVIILTPVLYFAYSTRSDIIWDGSFRQGEYQFTFLDSTEKPLSGVELVVKNKSGAPSYCYPVIEHRKKPPVLSDDKGVITFHHVNMGTEFSGRCVTYFGVFRQGGFEPPKYDCVFLYKGKEIAWMSFSDLELIEAKGKKVVERELDIECEPEGTHKDLSEQMKKIPKKSRFPVYEKTIVIK
jgi:hypothetical protein